MNNNIIIYQVNISISLKTISKSQPMIEKSMKKMPQASLNLQKQLTFNGQQYKFRGAINKNNQLIKTSTKRKLTQEQLGLMTKISHKNIIALKKIGKSKKNSQQQLYWLHYESIPFGLDMLYNKGQFDVRPQTVEGVLLDIKSYLFAIKICPKFSETNLGVNQNGVIKAYISIQNLLKPGLSQKLIEQCDTKIKQIKNWYGSFYYRRSLKPNQIPAPIPEKRLSQQKLNKFSQINQNFQKLKKNIRSQESNSNSVVSLLSPHGNQNKKFITQTKNLQIGKKFNYNLMGQKNSPVIHKNIQTIKYFQNRQAADRNQRQKAQNNKYQIHKNIDKYVIEYDGQSVDTYQMQLGQDFQMPSIRTNQRLRQTVLNNQKSWDTLTCKNAKNTNKAKKIHQSAGKKQFMSIVQNSKNLLKTEHTHINQTSSDHKTQQLYLKQKNWQSSTIKSALPSNIQDRVQQALMKTKNVMMMLNTKSYSAAK